MAVWSTPAGEVFTALASDPVRGLNDRQVRERQEEYGPNRLEKKKKRSIAVRFLLQMKDPMIAVLLAAAGISVWAGGGRDYLDAVIILLIVLGNACISLLQESSAEKALAALGSMAAVRAQVVRGAETHTVPADELVPGDILLLSAGDLVSADARIVECEGLKTDESAMTGESEPAGKDPAPVGERVALAERACMVLAGTVVVAGRGRCVVTATGMDTEMGRIAALLSDGGEEPTPLQRRMGEISRVLSVGCLAVCAATFALGLVRGEEPGGMFLTAVSLAVAAIPEGLGAVVTIVQALGVRRLARRGAVIRRLGAVETLGCAGVICSDKTGTLTENRMAVTRVWPEENAASCLRAAVLCSDETGPDGLPDDPTEAAIVRCARERGLTGEPAEGERRGEIPFESVRKRRSVFYRTGDGARVYVKGAPEVVLGRCTSILKNGAVRPMTDADRRAIRAMNDAMADGALRVLASAYRDAGFFPRAGEEEALERELIFTGLIGMSDPPRAGARRAVEDCRRAGIRPVVITGDHRRTALAVAKELDIWREGDLTVTGAELDFLPQETLEEMAERVSVYARVTPEHKMRIVRAWRARGKVVAMTGDGVNDAPALRAADIGCAMGKSGTEVARAAGDLILTDDDFAAIVAAVGEGRGIYANVRKAIHYLLSCNIGEILTLFVAVALGLPSPLTPAQLLWLNLVTDSLPALALGGEPLEPGVLDEPPRGREESFFTPAFSLRLLWQGALIGGVTLAAWLLGAYVLPGASLPAAGTMAFATLTFSQLFHAFDVRSADTGVLRLGLLTNGAMVWAFLAGAALQLAALCIPPVMGAFSAVGLTLPQWEAVVGLSLTPALVCECEKTVRTARRRARHMAKKAPVYSSTPASR